MNKMQMAKEEKDMMADHDLRTLIEAAKIKKDKERFGMAMKKHKEMMDAMESMGMHSGHKMEKGK